MQGKNLPVRYEELDPLGNPLLFPKFSKPTESQTRNQRDGHQNANFFFPEKSCVDARDIGGVKYAY